MIVKSCFGRFDIVNFQQVEDLDPGVAAEAVDQLKARVAAFRNATDN